MHAFGTLFYAAFPRGKDLFHGRKHVAHGDIVRPPVPHSVVALDARALPRFVVARRFQNRGDGIERLPVP